MSIQHDKSGDQNPFFGKTHTKAAKARIAEAARLRQMGCSRPAAVRLKIGLSNLRTKAAKDGISVGEVPDEELKAFVKAARQRLGRVPAPPGGKKRGPKTAEGRARIGLCLMRRRAMQDGIDVSRVTDSRLRAFVTEARRLRKEAGIHTPQTVPQSPWTPERRAGAALRMKKRWSEQTYRDQMIATKRAFSHTPESKAKIAQANRKRLGVFKHSEATKEKISASSAWRARKGSFKYLGWVRTKKGIPKKGRTEIGFRSLWEKHAMRLLDESSSVLSFQYEPLGVPYIWQGKNRFTIPDFLVKMVDDSTVMIEVKPKGYTYNVKERAKADACTRFCDLSGWKYEVWDERRLWPGLSQSEVREAVRRLT